MQLRLQRISAAHRQLLWVPAVPQHLHHQWHGVRLRGQLRGDAQHQLLRLVQPEADQTEEQHFRIYASRPGTMKVYP